MARALAQALAEDYMNKIKRLFDEEFVLDFFRREVLPFYPDFRGIERVTIKAYKNLVWETTYHVVLGFEAYFVRADGTEAMIPIFCSAHSSEPRENVYHALKYLWDQGFPTATIDLPAPLFYQPDFRAIFYQGLDGENLFYHIDRQDREAVEQIVQASGLMFARLHSLPALPEANFNPHNGRIATVTPGRAVVRREMSARYGRRYDQVLENLYDYFIAQEDKFFNSGQPLCLIHGDAHTENIIQTGPDRIGLIDFTDICLGDFTRDLGTFTQQLDYKAGHKFDAQYLEHLKERFFAAYWQASERSSSPIITERIQLYYNWTAVRTAIYWFMKHGSDEGKADRILKRVMERLKLSGTVFDG